MPITWLISGLESTYSAVRFSGATSDIRNIFGGNFGPFAGITLFQDELPAGTIHSVEWQTAQPIELESFNIFANHDGGEFDANFRGFSAFRLFAQDLVTSNFELLAENRLGAYTLASPAISGSRIFLRTETHLGCVGRKDEK